MQKSRKEPEVVVFEEPKYHIRKGGKEEAKERKIFLDGNVAEIFALGDKVTGDNKHDASDEEDDLTEGRNAKKKKKNMENDADQDFRSIFRDVQKFATSALTGREKWRHVEERIKALGGKERKKRVPYPVYQEMMKQKKQEEKERRSDGMTSSKPKKDPTKPKGKGRWKDKVISLDPPVGRFKKGVLKLTEPDIKKFH